MRVELARCFIGFLIFSRKSLGKTFKETLDGRIESIQEELQQFFNPNEVIPEESNEQQRLLRVSLRICSTVVESLPTARGERPTKIGYSWFSAKSISVERMMSMARGRALIEVDNRVVVPAKTHLRMIVTPADVPHSWAVPSSGVKCDAVPGRSNLTSISVQREGVYYGQCSEICGTNHAVTPIVVEAVTLKDYADWNKVMR